MTDISPIIERIYRGHCWIKTDDGPRRIAERFTDDKLAAHIAGKQAYGACPITPGTNTTRLALFDLDNHKGEATWEEMIAIATLIQRSLTAMNLYGWAWRSSGGSGIHVFILWEQPQDAYSVRQAMQNVLQECVLVSGTGGVAKGEVEIFPKQDSVPLDGSGSMFVLPLAGKSETLGEDEPSMSTPVPILTAPVREATVIDTPELKTLQSALKKIPNDGGDALNYDEWFRIICGIHHATDGSDEGLELAREFSARATKFDDDFFTTRVWPYIHQDRQGEVVTSASITYLARQHGWDGDVASDFDVVVQPDPPAKPAARNQIVPYGEFCDALEPPQYVWHRVLQKGCVYGFTARWGDGKTAIALTVAFHVAMGRLLQNHPTEKCKVLYLCGENPADVRLRAHAAAEHFEIEGSAIAEQIYFTLRPFQLDNPKSLKSFLDAAAPLGPFGLVVIDTGPAHTGAEQENDNREMHNLAIAMRDVVEPLGNPAVLALMHPAKSATRDSLEPRGGGAFSGSIDGELCAWQEQRGTIEFFHRSKFRGPGFAPMFFKLEQHDLDILDNFGEPTLTVLAIETDARPDKKLPALGKNEKRIHTALKVMCGVNEILEVEQLKIKALPMLEASSTTRADGGKPQRFIEALRTLCRKGYALLNTDETMVELIVEGD